MANTTPVPQPTPSSGGSGPMGTSEDYLSMPKAGFLYRFIAALIDGIILSIVNFIISSIFGFSMISGISVNPAELASRYSVVSAISLLIGVAYFVYFWGSTGATPGKMALGLKIIGTDGSMPIGYPKAFVRYIGYIISSMICLLGHLLIIVDDDNQALHDKIASTYVVKV